MRAVQSAKTLATNSTLIGRSSIHASTTPRRIVREALAEEDGQHAQQTHQAQQSQTATQTAVTVSPIERYMEQAKKRDRSKPAPFDSEAT